MLSLATFREYFVSVCGVRPGEPVLAAVSGGMDSVVLCDLLKAADVPFAVAHVNYALRGEESWADERFVSELAKQLDVPFYVRRIPPENFIAGRSVQEEARRLRYTFLEETATAQGFVHIAVAHHFDDSIETALLNFARGTGIAGLEGISPVNGKVIRPLLSFKRNEVEAYAKERQLNWREDSSNATDAYSRNRFRHHLLPWLMGEIPQGYGGFAASFSKLSETAQLLDAALEAWEKHCCTPEGEATRISLETAMAYPQALLFLRAFLRKHNFKDSELEGLEKFVNGRIGTLLHNFSFRLYRERDALYLVPKNMSWREPQDFFEMTLGDFDGNIPSDPWTAVLDADSFNMYPHVRLWEHGDSMTPLGMTGRRNVSDILNELKVPQHIREHAVVVKSGSQIIWVPGYRIAEACKVHAGTKRVYRFTFDQERYAGRL